MPCFMTFSLEIFYILLALRTRKNVINKNPIIKLEIRGKFPILHCNDNGSRHNALAYRPLEGQTSNPDVIHFMSSLKRFNE